MKTRICTLLIALLAIAQGAWAYVYDIRVAGVKVTSDNCSNITGEGISGKVSYDPETRTMTLEDATIDVTDSNGIELNIMFSQLDGDDFTLVLKGDNKILVKQTDTVVRHAIQSFVTTYIKGPGTLESNDDFEVQDDCYISGGCKITGIYFHTDDYYGTGYTFSVSGADTKLDMQSDYSGVIGYDHFVLNDGLKIIRPKDGYYDTDEKYVVDANGERAVRLKIASTEDEEDNWPFIMVAGQLVTKDNASNVTGEGIGGKVSYDPATATLTLDNTIVSCSDDNSIIMSDDGGTIDHFTIKLIGDNHISNPREVSSSWQFYLNTTITGPGALNLEGAIYINGKNSLSIDGNCHIAASALVSWDFTDVPLIVSGAGTEIELSNNIFYFPSLTLNDGLAIVEPKGGHYVSKYRVVTTSGAEANGVIIRRSKAYNFRVGGITVDEENAYDVLGDGKVSYDDATKTLTLDNVSITLLDDIVIRVDESFEGEDFTINLVGENKLDNWGGYYDIQMLEKNGIFTGTGSLSGSICAGKGITIEGGCEINADKISGCASEYSTPLTISGAETKVYAEYGIVDIASLTLNDGLAIVQPEGARFNALKQCIVDADGNQATGVLIKMPPKKYDLWVGGTQVVEDFAYDIMGDGHVSYDETANTLTLDNATINNDASDTDAASQYGKALVTNIPGLKVVVNGKTNITSSHNTAVTFQGDVTLCGSGTLTATAPTSLFVAQNSTLTVNGGVRLIAHGTVYYGIIGSLKPPSGTPTSNLVVEGANTEVRAYGPYGSIIRLESFTLNDGLVLNEPEGAHFEGMHVYDGEGNIVQKQWVVISKPYEVYDLWVGGVRVNEHNRFDIDGNGNIKYDLANKKLTVGCDITTNGSPAIESHIDGLQIELKNNIALSAEGEGCAAIKATGSTTLRGTGSNNVTLTGTENAVSISSGTLSLSAMNLVATGRQALLGITGEKRCHLTITGATLDVTSADGEAAIAGFSEGIMLSSCEITEPAGGQIAGGQVVDASGNVASHVVISRVYNYSIFVNEQSVTQGNCDDILGDGLFSYDPETMTLHVKGSYETTRDHVIRNRTFGVTISVDADAELKSGDAAILLETATTLTGSHQLSLLSEKKGIEVTTSSSLLIEDANLYVSGKYGLSGATGKESKLIIRNARVQVEATMRGIYDFMGGIELEDCAITLPGGGYVNYGEIVNSKGNTAKKITIEPTGVATGMESLTPSPSPKGEGSWYTLGGQKLDAQPAKPGIYLYQGRKVVVK